MTDPRPGLTGAEAAARFRADGPNELPRPEHRSFIRIVADVLREPMLALLLGGGAIYLLLGEVKDAAILLGFACLSVAITVIQETRTERVLEALRDLTSPRALVLRDGVRKRVAGRDVVRGDVILLGEGDRVPADAMLFASQDLEADESLLTGESIPVRKEIAGAGPAAAAMVFSGSLVVRGAGRAEVTATGAATEIGKIGRSLAALESEPPRLQRQTRRMVLLFAALGGAVSLLVTLLYGLLRGSWLDALLAGIAIGMSMLPEEFPVVLTIFMAMGAWRISRARVLTRRAAAIEALGSATVLCTDKTGTLTQNRMAIREVRPATGGMQRFADDVQAAVGAEVAGLLRHGLLASAPEPFDPMEKAFHAMRGSDPREAAAEDRLRLVQTYPLTPGLLAMSQIWQAADGSLVVAAKGAPEAIAGLCGLDAEAQARLAASADAMAAEGLRVLGIAGGVLAGPSWPADQRGLPLTYLGLAGLADPLRPSVPDAVAECRKAGIRVKMITGDYPVTAAAIAREAGFGSGTAVTGKELETLDAAALAARLEDADVFARIMPQQKLRIVEALKAAGEVVAMTGDGVNDAPSLKAAHIGIAMGGRGTDVAREASAIVLLDDDFGSIVKAVRLGRRIYDNLRKASAFIFAVHLPIAGLAVLPLMFGLPIILGPVHIAFLEMVIDPVCTLVFEGEEEEPDIMERPPRKPDEPLFSWRLIGWSLSQGAVALAAVASVLFYAADAGMPENELRALAFFALVVVIAALIFVNRSFRPSLAGAFGRLRPTLFAVIGAVSAALALSLTWPALKDVFRFGPLHGDDLAIAAASGAAVLLLLELVKPLWRESSAR